MTDINLQKAKAFHGHECPGLAIGIRACEAAIEALEINPALDEELICIAENDSCSVDAVQALLGCTVGKGNLIFKLIGKQAFTFINRNTKKAVRLYLKAKNNGMERSEYQAYLLKASINELFDCKQVEATIPEKARIFTSVTCELCHEAAAEHKMRLQDGKKVCLDCFCDYSRQL